MTSAQYVTSLMVLSVKKPTEGMRAILALKLSREVIWLGLAVTVVVGTILGYLHDAVRPAVVTQQGQQLQLPGPIVSVIATALLLVTLDFIIAKIGRAFGGTGDFFDILLADVWLRLIGMCAMVIDIIAYLISPPLGQMILIASYLYLFWMMLNFVSEAHGGLHLGKTALLVILAALVTVIPFTIILSILGIGIGV